MVNFMSELPYFSSKAFLAPMAGVSDPALRLMCKKMGAGLVVTELTSVNAIVAKQKQLHTQMKSITDFIEFSEKERPLSIQLFGSDIIALEKAAKIVEPFFDIIDYNMGCPAPHITKQMAGGALLQNKSLTKEIFRTLVNSVRRPISLKMRIGVTESNKTLFQDSYENISEAYAPVSNIERVSVGILTNTFYKVSIDSSYTQNFEGSSEAMYGKFYV